MNACDLFPERRRADFRERALRIRTRIGVGDAIEAFVRSPQFDLGADRGAPP